MPQGRPCPVGKKHAIVNKYIKMSINQSFSCYLIPSRPFIYTKINWEKVKFGRLKASVLDKEVGLFETYEDARDELIISGSD